MSAGDGVFRRLQAKAKSHAARTGGAAPTQEYLMRHLLESGVDRLSRTRHGDEFVLKGGVLLAAYGVRRPTKDADLNAVAADVSVDHLVTVLEDVAGIEAEDGVDFDLATIDVRAIREEFRYPAYRLRMKARIGSWRGVAAWDVTTGDPIVPVPRRVRLDRILGDPIDVLGYAPETSIAEKGVTILERGVTSTRWRDYVDIVRLAERGIDTDELLAAARAVARHRGIRLEPVGPHLVGYADIGQAKWSAWRRKEKVEEMSEPALTDQIARVVGVLDPVFARGE